MVVPSLECRNSETTERLAIGYVSQRVSSPKDDFLPSSQNLRGKSEGTRYLGDAIILVAVGRWKALPVHRSCGPVLEYNALGGLFPSSRQPEMHRQDTIPTRSACSVICLCVRDCTHETNVGPYQRDYCSSTMFAERPRQSIAKASDTAQ